MISLGVEEQKLTSRLYLPYLILVSFLFFVSLDVGKTVVNALLVMCVTLLNADCFGLI